MQQNSENILHNEPPGPASSHTHLTTEDIGVATYGIGGMIAASGEGEALGRFAISHLSPLVSDSCTVTTDAADWPKRIFVRSATRESGDCIDSARVGTIVRYAAVHLAIIVGGNRSEVDTGLGSAGHEQNSGRSDGGETEMHL